MLSDTSLNAQDSSIPQDLDNANAIMVLRAEIQDIKAHLIVLLDQQEYNPLEFEGGYGGTDPD